MSNPDHDELLKILNAHGQQFLGSFSLPVASGSKRRNSEDSPRPAKVSKKTLVQASENEDEEEEEWFGIGQVSEDESDDEDEGSLPSDFEQEDDEFTSAAPDAFKTVVFSDIAKPTQSSLPSLAQKKAFMSSKVSKLRDDHVSASAASTSRAEDEEEKSNIQNDALLHRLVHTKLLSGSLNPELNLTSAERKKALSGRVLELSGQAKLGKGEKSVRQGERNKASKRVREGLLSKQKERQAQKLEEAKNLGNYHPTLKKLFEPDSENKPKKQRERGMRMGVGTFGGGVLKLSREDVHRAQGGGRGPGGPKKKGRR